MVSTWCHLGRPCGWTCRINVCIQSGTSIKTHQVNKARAPQWPPYCQIKHMLLASCFTWPLGSIWCGWLPSSNFFFFRGQSHKIDLICPGGLCWIIFLCVPVKSWCCQGCDAYLSPILLRNLISSFPFNRHAYVDDAQHKTANLPQEVLLTALALIYWHQFSLLHVFALLFSPAPSQGSLRLAPTISCLEEQGFFPWCPAISFVLFTPFIKKMHFINSSLKKIITLISCPLMHGFNTLIFIVIIVIFGLIANILKGYIFISPQLPLSSTLLWKLFT